MGYSLRAENERIAAMVNKAWGTRVAWVEDREFTRVKHTITLPVAVSKLVNGRLPGRATYPAFFAGPAPSYNK